MTKRKLLATGLAALASVLLLTGDASAFGKRGKKNSGCGGCSGGGMAYAPAYGGAGCGGCGTAAGYGSFSGGYAVGPVTGPVMAGQVPVAMPATGITGGTAQANPSTTQPGTVTPASGTDTGSVVPATGTTVFQQGTVMPAGGYYQNGQYVMPAGGYYQNGNYVYPAGYNTGTQNAAYGNTTGRRGLFRR